MALILACVMQSLRHPMDRVHQGGSVALGKLGADATRIVRFDRSQPLLDTSKAANGIELLMILYLAVACVAQWLTDRRQTCAM
jgi:hypothetical protein